MKKFLRSLLGLAFSIFIITSTLPKEVMAAETEPEITAKDHQKVTVVTEEQYLNNITAINVPNGKELTNLIKSDGSYFLFIGYKECPYCREFSKVLAEFKNQSKLPIYYVNLNIPYANELSQEEFKEMSGFFNEKIGLQYTPTFVRIEKQIPVSGFVGGETTLNELQSINN